MKKSLLVVIALLAMVSVGFANNDNTLIGSGTQVNGNNNVVGGTSAGSITANGGSATATANGGAGGSVNIGTGIFSGGNFSPSASSNVENRNYNTTDIDLTFRPTNTNIGVNSQEQRQSQMQGQIQGQNNEQIIAPKQVVKIENPVQLPIMPTPGLSDLTFGNGRIKLSFPIGFNTDIPEFDPRTMRVSKQIDSVANVPLKNFLGAAADLLAKYAGQDPTYAYIIMTVEANKTSQAGVNLNAVGSGVASPGGGGAGGLLGFQIGVTKAHDLGTIVIVKTVAPATARPKVIYEKKAPKAEAPAAPKSHSERGWFKF